MSSHCRVSTTLRLGFIFENSHRNILFRVIYLLPGIRCKGVVYVQAQSILQSLKPEDAELQESVRSNLANRRDSQGDGDRPTISPDGVFLLVRFVYSCAAGVRAYFLVCWRCYISVIFSRFLFYFKPSFLQVNWAFGREMYVCLSDISSSFFAPSPIFLSVVTSLEEKLQKAGQKVSQQHQSSTCVASCGGCSDHRPTTDEVREQPNNESTIFGQTSVFSRLTLMGVGIASHFFRATVASSLSTVVPIPLKSSIEEVLTQNKGIVCSVMESHSH